MGKNWKIPSLDDFVESLIHEHEQNKIIHIGAVKASTYYVLTMMDDNKKGQEKTRDIDHIHGEGS